MKHLWQTLLVFFLALVALAAPAFADSTVSYSYDALGRLVRSVSSGTSTADTSYSLDPAGNRTNVTVTGVPVPLFSINSVSVTEGGTATLTVTKSGTATGTLTIDYASADGTAAAGSDYTATGTQTLTFLAADTSKTINIPTTDDALIEGAEAFTVTLSNNSAGSAIGQGTGTVTINDNDATSFAISNAPAVTEGGNLVYTVTKTGSVAANVTYATADGTATAGSDYTASGAQTLVFAASDTTKMITVATTDDAAVESAETVLVNLSAPTNGATIATAQGSGTINDNDASFAISNAPAVTEGGNLVYTVTKTGSGAGSVNYATADGTATAGSDYTAASGALTFLAGDTTKTITVSTIDDAAIESAETVLVNLSGATITTAQGSGTINDNDATSFAISAAPAVTEGGNLVYTVTKTGPVAADVSFVTADGTATAGSDYTASSGTLSFLAGDSTKTITVSTIDDATSESAETVLVNLSTPTNGATTTTAQGSGTINDNDAPPPPSFAISAASVTEGGAMVFTVTKTGTTSSSYTINYATADGTAVAGSDYTAASGTLTFLATDTSKTISIATSNDTIEEGTESFSANLSNVSGGATITTAQGIGTINDNDPAPSFSINSVSGVEGTSLVFTVTKTGATTSSYSVNYATASGTATSGTDFTATSGTLTFLAGDTSKTISVATTDDAAIENSETFTVTLSNATGGSTIGTAQGTGTISDNDSPPPSFKVGNDSAVEGTNLRFVVTMTGVTSASYSVNYATANGTAIAGSDYTAKSGTLTFAATSTSPTTKTILVSTIDDTAVESNETVKLNLSGATGGATITDTQGLGTITDNDVPPCAGVSFAVADYPGGEEGFPVVFTITKTGTTSSSCSVNYATANGTAVAGSDYTATSGTVTFLSSDMTKTVSVSALRDGITEPDETMYLNLSAPSGGATIADSQGLGTITDYQPETCRTCLTGH